MKFIVFSDEGVSVNPMHIESIRIKDNRVMYARQV